MPATNPRLTITLSPQVAAVLRHLSEITGNSQSSMIAELLHESLPIFERMAKVMEAAKAAQTALSSEMASSLERAQTQIEAQLGLVLEQFDEGAAPILELAESIKRRRPRGLSTPVPVTRGSGTPKGPQKGKGKGTGKAVGTSAKPDQSKPLVSPDSVVGQALVDLKKQGKLSARDLKSVTGVKAKGARRGTV
jgi:hypothetical protein